MVKLLLNSTLLQLATTTITFLFGVLMAYYFGSSPLMDAYVVSATIISISLSLLSSAQGKALIPFIRSISTPNKRFEASSSIISFNRVSFLVISTLVFVLAPYVVFLLAPGLSKEQLAVATSLLQISAFYIFFSNSAAIGRAFIELHLSPKTSLFIKLIQAILLILIFLILREPLGIYSLPASHLISMMLSIPAYIIFLKGKGYSLSNKLPLWNQHIKTYLILFMPLILGQILVRTVKLSDSFLASFLESGSLSNLSYATRITNNFHHLFAAIHIIYFPLLAKLNKGDNSKHASTFHEGFNLLFLAVSTFSIFLFYFSPEVIQLVFERGSFTAKETIVVSNLMRAYILMIVCAPLGNYLANAYFSRKYTKLATSYSVIMSISNLLLNILFINYWGLYGLAIASSLAFFIYIFLQVFNISKVNPAIRTRGLIKDQLFTLFCISTAFLPFLFIDKTLFQTTNLTQTTLLGLTFIAYLFVIVILLTLTKHPLGQALLRKVFNANKNSTKNH